MWTDADLNRIRHLIHTEIGDDVVVEFDEMFKSEWKKGAYYAIDCGGLAFFYWPGKDEAAKIDYYQIGDNREDRYGTFEGAMREVIRQLKCSVK